MKQFKVTERKTDRTSVMEKYFSEISKIPILDPDKEYEIAVAARNGDAVAKEMLIRANLRFVVSVAKSYSGDNFPLSDLISQGNIGLIESVDTFDPSTGFKFISYAVWRIRASILKYIGQQSRIIRVPQGVLNTISEIKKMNAQCNQKHERDLTPSEISEFISGLEDKTWVTKNKDIVFQAMPLLSPATPLELRNGEDEDKVKAPISWMESEESGYAAIQSSENSKIVEDLLKCLNYVEIKVVTYRIGKDYGVPRSFSSIANEFGKTQDWAKKTYEKSIKKLKIRARKLGINKEFEL